MFSLNCKHNTQHIKQHIKQHTTQLNSNPTQPTEVIWQVTLAAEYKLHSVFPQNGNHAVVSEWSYPILNCIYRTIITTRRSLESVSFLPYRYSELVWLLVIAIIAVTEIQLDITMLTPSKKGVEQAIKQTY